MAKSGKAPIKKLNDLISREEWDFNTSVGGYLGCPDDQLEECKVYECARRSEFWPMLFKYLKENANPKDKDAGVPYGQWARIFAFLNTFAEFPKQPWLSIDPQKRKILLERFSHRGTTRPPLMEADPSMLEYAFLDDFGDAEDSDNGPFWSDGREILTQYKQSNAALMDPVYHLRICWEHSSKDLCVAFEKWLIDHRPFETNLFKKRGRHSLRNDALRNSLDAIGAWTLTRDPKVSQYLKIEKLITSTRAIAKDKGGASRSLYSDRKRWNSAIDQAEENIQSLIPDDLLISFLPRNLPQSPVQELAVRVKMVGGEVLFTALTKK